MSESADNKQHQLELQVPDATVQLQLKQDGDQIIISPPNESLDASNVSKLDINNTEKKRRKKKKRQTHKSKMITGYIIYASEIRKDVIKKYPDRDFGDISKLVGIDWKNLPRETKIAYEQRAQEQNAKSLQYYNSQPLQQQPNSSQLPTPLLNQQQVQSQRNNIVYRKPVTVRLRPKDEATQTDPVIWNKSKPKLPLKFSQKFMDYLNGECLTLMNH